MNTVRATHEGIINKAFNGDANSKVQLTKLAQGLLEHNLNEDAAVLFKEVAGSYRVGEFRASALVAELTKEREALQAEIQLLEVWIQSHPAGFTPIPVTASGITSDDIWGSLAGRAMDLPCQCALGILERELTKLGEEFFSPGGTVDRRACVLLVQYFGVEKMAEPEIFAVQRIRIALDLLADATIRLVQ